MHGHGQAVEATGRIRTGLLERFVLFGVSRTPAKKLNRIFVDRFGFLGRRLRQNLHILFQKRANSRSISVWRSRRMIALDDISTGFFILQPININEVFETSGKGLHRNQAGF